MVETTGWPKKVKCLTDHKTKAYVVKFPKKFVSYINNKIWDVPSVQQPVTIQQLPAAIVQECQNVPRALIQRAFDGMVDRCCECQNVGEYLFPNE